MHPDVANARIGVAHAYIAEVVEEGGSEFAERVRGMNAATGLSGPAASVRNAEALAALAAEVAALREQTASTKSAAKKKAS